ncbi:MAG: tetratricopeptide repeat protein, partial [Bdellovibrionales bacterium]|nr:tetratricopeptide repeat protein [Bdellovibrionales bacterium]
SCPKCSTAYAANARFCENCGWKRGRVYVKFTPLRIILTLLVAIPLWYAGYTAQDNLAGPKPIAGASENHFARSIAASEGVEKLRASLKAHPDNIEILHALADSLGEELMAQEKPPQELVFELIDVLNQILKVDPKDGQAILTLANISYNSQAFDKAREFFERYLELNPSDLRVKNVYASTLTFLGEYSLAQETLFQIKQQDPKNFLTLANLSINSLQQGELSQANQWKDEAISNAPTDAEAKRYETFFNSLLESHESSKVATSSDIPHTSSQSDGLEEFLRSHPIAGPKFERIDRESKAKFKIYFHDFPMSGMPKFVKDKF